MKKLLLILLALISFIQVSKQYVKETNNNQNANSVLTVDFSDDDNPLFINI